MAKKVRDPGVPRTDPALILIYIAVTVLAIVWVALHVGNWLAPNEQQVPANPIEIVANLARGRLQWPWEATATLIVMIAGGVAALFARRQLLRRTRAGSFPVDEKAGFLAAGSQVYGLTEAGVRAKAQQLGLRLGVDDAPGVPIGVSVADGRQLYGSYEDLHLDIWGPRTGKSTARVIPAILAAIGPVLVTSNKRDVVDATRDVRAAKGSATFIFDPQGVAGEEPTWFWDPLSWVDARTEGCEMRAARLAGHFADDDAERDQTDSFFDPEAEDLLSGLFLAAAVALQPITQVWEWVTNPQNTEPIEILRRARHHFSASGLSAQYNTDPRTKSGVFSVAKKMIRCLKLSNVHAWVTPIPVRLQDGRELANRPAFDELEFLERNGTLYSLSLEGRGSAAPLVSALTEAVVDVAMRKAARSHFGRLPIPLLAVLDEAANVVRWRELPKQYSHFGSRGIVVMTVLQSWAQGARCWGEAGMAALWSAATIKVLGSGVDDTRFLTERSEAIGDHDAIVYGLSESRGSRTYSRSLSSSRTLTVKTLATLPRGRVVVFSSGAPPVLARTVPWWEGPYAGAVRQSIAHRDPMRPTTMTDLIDQRALVVNNPTPPYGNVEEVEPL